MPACGSARRVRCFIPDSPLCCRSCQGDFVACSTMDTTERAIVPCWVPTRRALQRCGERRRTRRRRIVYDALRCSVRSFRVARPCGRGKPSGNVLDTGHGPTADCTQHVTRCRRGAPPGALSLHPLVLTVSRGIPSSCRGNPVFVALRSSSDAEALRNRCAHARVRRDADGVGWG